MSLLATCNEADQPPIWTLRSLQVYQRGMQLMQSRLRGAALPPPAAQVPAQQQQQQQPYGLGAHAQSALSHHQQIYEAQQQQQQQQQMLLYCQQEQQRQQMLLQQQAEAAAFPELPGVEDGAGVEHGQAGSYPAAQQWQQAHAQAGQYGSGRLGGHALPPLHGGRPTAGLPASGAAYGAAAQAHAQAGYAGRWPVGQQGGSGHYQPQQAGVDEFGVSMQPSMSDDESDNAAVQQQQQQQAAPAVYSAQPGRGAALQQVQQLLVPGRSGTAGPEGGQMVAFLGSRKRDFSVPRSASKPPAPAGAQRGAGQVTLADAE